MAHYSYQPTQTGYAPINAETTSLLSTQSISPHTARGTAGTDTWPRAYGTAPPPNSPYEPHNFAGSGPSHVQHSSHPKHRHSPPAFWFVFAGMIHFIHHMHLWPPFLKRIPKLLILSTFVLTILFVFTYLPHVAILILFHGPLAWINAAFMVLNEAAMIITFVAENFMVEEGLVDVFDAVLIDHGLASLVATARELKDAPTSVKALGKYTKSPYLRFSLSLTLKFILTLPLNFIPLVGPFLYILAQGYLAGPLAHYRYFQLKGLTPEEEKKWKKDKVWAYLGFGATHITFQLFPVLSIFFLFTTACGAGLWTVEIERREGVLSGGGADDEDRLCHRF